MRWDVWIDVLFFFFLNDLFAMRGAKDYWNGTWRYERTVTLDR